MQWYTTLALLYIYGHVLRPGHEPLVQPLNLEHSGLFKPGVAHA